MRMHPIILAALLCAMQAYPASAGQLVVPSEPVVRGSIRSSLSHATKCLSVPVTEILPGARLEMRPCTNSADQIFEWNVLSFEVKIHKLCVAILRSGEGDAQPNDPVGLWYCQGTQIQKWFPIGAGPFAPEFSVFGGGTPTGNLCLDVLDGGNGDAARLAISVCDGRDSQQFRLRPWPPLDRRVSSAMPDALRYSLAP